MSSHPWMSIVIAGYNSEHHLAGLAKCLGEQIPPNEGSHLEVLFVDGGSQDDSRGLATRFGFRVVDNPHGDPIHAKWIGLLNASSRYVCFLDHDERLVQPHSLLMKHQLLQGATKLRIVLPSGYALAGESATNAYASEFGDPFSLFAYRSPNRDGFRLRSMRKRLRIHSESPVATLMHAVSRRPVQCEPVAGACVIDAAYFLNLVPELISNPQLLPHVYYLMALRDADSLIAVTHTDPIRHHSVDSLGSLMRKIQWRVINAGWDTELSKSGFLGRRQILREIKMKRGAIADLITLSPIAFALYVLTVLPVLIDSMQLALHRKSPGYLIHFPLSWTVVFWGISARVGKLFGKSRNLKRYGE